MSELAVLQIRVDASGAIRVVDQFGTSVEQTAKKADSLRDAAKRVGTVLGTTMVAGLALAIKETVDAQREQAQLAATLRSTAGASGQTLDSLNAHAASLRTLTAATGGQISEAQALLLTFTKIGGEVFPQATATVLDMAQALGTDARGAAMQLGKALNDPLVGITALGRAGVQFNDTQKAQIKAFVETNQLAKAQAIILAELQTQVGGSATAYRNTLGGALASVKESFLELFEVTSPGMTGLVESINMLADMIAMIPTRLEQAKTGMASFFNRAGIALLEFNQRGRPSAMLDTMRGRQAQLDTDMAGLAALAAEQYQTVIDAAVARAKAGLPKALGGASGTDAPAVVAAAEAVNKFDRDIKALGDTLDEASQKIDTALKRIGETAKAVETQALKNDRNLKGSMGGLKVAVDEVSESVRVFREQTQIALGRFFADFLKSGTQSLGAFWEQFKQLGREAVGNVLAREVMEKVAKPLGDGIKNLFSGMGSVGGGIFGGLLIGALNAFTSGANRFAVAMEEAARNIEAFGARPARDQLDATQKALLDLIAERDTLARQAAAAAGFTGGDGTSGGIAAAARNQLKAMQSLPDTSATRAITKRLTDLIKALGDLDKAFASNVDAAKAAAVAAENQVKAERWAAKQRQADSLAAFRDSLNLGGQSPLSPTGQLAEARRQYEVIMALAKTGDQSAISSLPETARTLLDASRAVNASGARYAQDFAAVQADTLSIIEQLRTQTGEDVFDVSDEILDRVDPYFTEQISIASSSLTVQQVGFQTMIEELVNVRTELTVMKDALKLSLEDVAMAVS